MDLVHERVFDIMAVMLDVNKAIHVYISFDFTQDNKGRRRSISYSFGEVPIDVTDDEEHHDYD